MLETLSASLYIDFGDGLGMSPSGVEAISALLPLRFSSDPKGATIMKFVYKETRNAWKLSSTQMGSDEP